MARVAIAKLAILTFARVCVGPDSDWWEALAQARYAAGTREILECWFEGRPIRDEYLIVAGGKPAGTGARSYTVGGARKAVAALRK